MFWQVCPTWILGSTGSRNRAIAHHADMMAFSSQMPSDVPPPPPITGSIPIPKILFVLLISHYCFLFIFISSYLFSRKYLDSGFRNSSLIYGMLSYKLETRVPTPANQRFLKKKKVNVPSSRLPFLFLFPSGFRKSL